MKAKIIKTILLITAFFFFASWFYRLLMLIILAKVWREEIALKNHWYYRLTILVLIFGLIYTLPRYRYNNSDRVRLIYQDENAKPINPPLSHWLFNVIAPEEELCNLGIWGVRVMPKNMPVVGWLLEEFKYDQKKGNIKNFYKGYKELSWDGLFMMSGITSQMTNMAGFDKTQSVYLISPNKFDKNKSYPLVFFMHGYMGNWKLYTSILKELEDCIVLCPGTDDWSGTFKKKDINDLFDKQISFIENLGLKVDRNNIHIMGLSNGGSASNIAYNSFSRKFKSITFISTGIHQSYPVQSKVLLIGGGKDHSSGSLPGAYKTIKSQGGKTGLFWRDDETHFILVNQTEDIVNFLNESIK